MGFDLDSAPPFFDIIEIMMAQGIIFTNDQYNNGALNEERCTHQVEKHVDFFVLLSLQDYKLVNANQYLIACSILCATRKQCGISPEWPSELEQLTGLQYSHFAIYEKRLTQKFELQYNKARKKSHSKDRKDNNGISQSKAVSN